ncbi:putative Surfeit locus protein 6 [Trypanosoma vivax]|uniref:Ribosomal RNA-processing protein 14/surfeit locus protein 6 C-terminal domain-containing protein n=1 Tax=Trypanosoma vivax (strain Y486) TaxID=1055687 RepID=G0UBD1_TRYVY|nr:putative Surfeit locus protein 6 [Trypanosoma vivax]KAH8606433.1 putative Surfeit locus protein 6 [Trypanosoma vivax]CCC53120.1 conserved hypothetical protein [Trypanosoma vivax Y486]
MPAKRSDNLALPGSSSIPINLSFGNFEFDEIKRTGQRGGGVRELSRSLRRAQQRAALHTQLLYTPGGVEERNAELLDTATRRAAGEKVKDDPKRLAKALARRRNKKRRSAKKWTRRMEQLKQSVDDVLEERARKRKAGRRTDVTMKGKRAKSGASKKLTGSDGGRKTSRGNVLAKKSKKGEAVAGKIKRSAAPKGTGGVGFGKKAPRRGR